MSLRINREKSILKERLIYKPNWEYIFEVVFEISLYSLWTIVSFLVILEPVNQINFATLIVILSINILALISWLYIYKLLKIEIYNSENDRKLLVEILKEEFPEFKINDNGLHMLRCKKNVGLFSWGKSLIVIFDEKKILINLSTLGRYETKSPLHSIINYLKLIKIRKEFNRRVNVR
jgi:hypothetical protein